MHERRIARRFLARPSAVVAPALIGQRLVRVLHDGTRLSGLIVETEAYLGEHDAAAHSFGLHRSPRNESMYGVAGTAYVYFTYGMHHCVNVVCGRVDEPVAVLIRALQPDEGMDTMRRHRAARRRRTSSPVRDHELCSGPARLCQALFIDRDLDGVDFVDGEKLFLERARSRAYPVSAITTTPRIGIDSAGDWVDRPLRWYLSGCPHVSAR